MQIKIFSHSGVGKREINEDYILINENENFFVVCDGVGGQQKGEVASKLAAENLDLELSRSNITKDRLERVSKILEFLFQSKTQSMPTAEGMATTAAFIKFNNDGFSQIGHCGDSRVYLFRNSKVVFKTTDHSYVQELVTSGFISDEEARVHPKKNVITRAIQATPNSVSFDLHEMKKTLNGDVFFICSDGVTESLTDVALASFFSEQNDLQNIAKAIISHCNRESKDNFSFIIVQVLKNENKSLFSAKINNSNKRNVVFFVILIIAVLSFIFYLI